jgi:hypothetical protein
MLLPHTSNPFNPGIVDTKDDDLLCLDIDAKKVDP